MQAQRIKAKVKRAQLKNDRAFRDCEPDVVYDATINLDDDDPVFGGEGIFNTVITGPGRIWLQSMPIAQMANTLRPFFPASR